MESAASLFSGLCASSFGPSTTATLAGIRTPPRGSAQWQWHFIWSLNFFQIEFGTLNELNRTATAALPVRRSPNSCSYFLPLCSPTTLRSVMPRPCQSHCKATFNTCRTSTAWGLVKSFGEKRVVTAPRTGEPYLRSGPVQRDILSSYRTS